MNVLFLSIGKLSTIYERGIYSDLLRCFAKNGQHVYTVTSDESLSKKSYNLLQEKNATILLVKTGKIERGEYIKKGINTLMIGYRYRKAIKHTIKNVPFDLIIYSTPPVTIANTIKYYKQKSNAKTYLLLKDIFPQNAVDIGVLSTLNVKGLIYKYFRNQEKKLYRISDKIGCMSPANVKYIIEHNPEIDALKVENCPNSIEIIDKSVDKIVKEKIRLKYGIPKNKMVFVYGGNLGKPQDIPFIIECLKGCKNIKEAFFLIIGRGTDYYLLEEYMRQSNQENYKLLRWIPKEDYDAMVGACDVGLIFLNHRFTVPNFPSRLLAYMQAKLPVLAVTDTNTDIGEIIVEGGFGWWCESNNVEFFVELVKKIVTLNTNNFGQKSYEFLKKEYNVNKTYNTIITGTLKIGESL